MTYGKRLKSARSHAKLNQVQLAEKSGVSQQTISKIERDRQEASVYTVQFARASGVRPEWLATGDGDMLEAGGRFHTREPAPADYGLSPIAIEIARAWSKLPLVMQTLYRDAIFRDAALEKILGGFKIRRPSQPSYDAFEKSVEASYARHQRQLELKLEQ